MIKENYHPLEGKYIIYKYGEQDTISEAWALALFRLREGRMENIYHPRDHVMEASDMGERNIAELLNLMKERGINNVFSVFHLEDFFGIPAHWFSLEHTPQGDEVEEWAEYASLHTDDAETNLLRERGITIEFYDARQEAR